MPTSLVEEEDLGIRHDGARDGDALCISEGQGQRAIRVGGQPRYDPAATSLALRDALVRVGGEPVGKGRRTLLAAREEHSPFSNLRVVAMRQRLDKAIGVGEFGGLDDALAARVARLVLEARANHAVLDVACDGRSEQRRLLRNEANLVAEPLDVQVLEGDVVELDDSSNRVVETLEEADDGRLSGARAADQCRHLAWREDTVEVVQDLRAGTMGPGTRCTVSSRAGLGPQRCEIRRTEQGRPSRRLRARSCLRRGRA